MLELIGHPFSSYTWKALIPLYEKGVAFALRIPGSNQPEETALLDSHGPAGKFPVLIDGDRAVAESSIIVEYLDQRFPDPPAMIPAEADAALAVRHMDRIFDNYVMGPMQAVVNEYLRDRDNPDHKRVAEARAALDRAYGWLEPRIGEPWACGAGFTLADCAGAPALFYADWVQPIGAARPRLSAYRARLLARPSVARCVDDARPFRPYFPLGAPDRD